MKRKATDEGGIAGPSKRPQVELEDAPASGASEDHETAESGSVYNDNDSASTITSPNGTQTAAATTIGSTATSSRRNRRFPSDQKTIQCTHPGCTKTFNRPARLTAHLRSHTNDRAFPCPYPDCDKDYLEEKHLTQHIKGSHTHEKNYVCPEEGCDKAFVTATRLRRHAEVHKGAEKYRCRGYGDCSLSFRKHQTLQRHIRVVHLGLKPFLCTTDGCTSAGFDSAGALRRHVERDHGTIRFWCDECQDDEGNKAGFTTLQLLKTHAREHIKCAFCPEINSFRGQAAYEHHMDIYHSGNTVEDRKTVACEWPGCDKLFTRTSNMKTHYRTAHEGRRFVCGQFDTYTTADIADWNWQEEGCGDEFISRMKLEEHVRYVHLGRKRPERAYPVPSAPAPSAVDGFTAGMKALECTVIGCQAKFKRYADLRKHIKGEHPENMNDDGLGYGNPVEIPVDPGLQSPIGEEAYHYPDPQQSLEDQLRAALEYPDLDAPDETFDYPEQVLLPQDDDQLSWLAKAEAEMDQQALYPPFDGNNQWDEEMMSQQQQQALESYI
ncbi:putative Zn-finger binding protein [Cladorrhinum sp. PSN332]|nr:putative Zn-finger binding protein [Cladorrhinum sp. PSN332]